MKRLKSSSGYLNGSFFRTVLVFIFAALFFSVSCVPSVPIVDPATFMPDATQPRLTGETDIPFTVSPSEPSFTEPVNSDMITDNPFSAAPTQTAETPTVTDTVTGFPTVQPTPTSPAETPSEPPTPVQSGEIDAVFIGVEGYGHVTAAEVMRPGARLYKFRIGSDIRLFSIRNTGGFPIQNRLMEGYAYSITVENDEITAIRRLDAPVRPKPVVSGTAGKRTLKNFIQTALMPLGSTLYVYGGGWDWQDEGSSVPSTTIGISGTWSEFFNSNDANYLYKDSQHPENSTYPFGGWNEYYYAGLDCSGYLGWVVYNTLENESGHAGYVIKARQFARSLAERNLGSFTTARLELGEGELRCGDIVSMNDHVWICVGRCSDSSLVILHSSPSSSVTYAKGGGVQLSALNPNGDSSDCEAYRLISRYQRQYCPEWAARYPAAMKSFSRYLGFERTGTSGIFRWNLDSSGLADPDGYSSMSAEEILSDLFGN